MLADHRVAAGWRQRGGRVAAGWRQTAGRLRGSANTAHQHTGGGGVCVCVVVSASVALLTTLTPANSQPLPHIHAPKYTRHTPATTVASHFIPTWPPQSSVKQGLGMLADHMVAAGWRQRGGRVAAARRQTAGRLRGSANTAHQHTGVKCVCVCVWWSQPLWLSSPHSLPPTPNHSLTFTRPNTHATRLPPPPHPILCRHGHHRAVSNKGWACWPTTWPTTWWRQRGGRVAAARRQKAGRLRGSANTAHQHTGGGGVCVCVVVSASVALLTTLTPANS